MYTGTVRGVSTIINHDDREYAAATSCSTTVLARPISLYIVHVGAYCSGYRLPGYSGLGALHRCTLMHVAGCWQDPTVGGSLSPTLAAWPLLPSHMLLVGFGFARGPGRTFVWDWD